MTPEAQEWTNDADYDLQSAKVMLDGGRYFFVVFMCHLSVEKLLKALFVERQTATPPKIHNLIALAVRAAVTIPPEFTPLINELDNLSVVTRYPDGRQAIAATLTQQYVTGLHQRTVEFSQWLRRELSS